MSFIKKIKRRISKRRARRKYRSLTPEELIRQIVAEEAKYDKPEGKP